SDRRTAAGTYVGGMGRRDPSVLVRQTDDGWERVGPGSTVYTPASLVSLPGFLSQINTRSGVGVLLRGHVPEFSIRDVGMMDLLLESAVVLYDSPKFDLDLWLKRGR